MEISRLTFTKETKEKMEKGLNRREAGRLRFERLKEAEEEGLLANVSTRIGVAKLAGFTDERYKTGYSWVSNLVTRGHLSETIRGFDEHNKATYEYHIIDNPTYTIRRGKTKRNNQVKVSKPERIMTSVTEVNDQRTYKLEITEGDMSIKVELPTAQDVITVITNVLIGRKK